MGYLLDTHTLLWASIDQKKLGKTTLRLLQRSTFISYSSLSIAELKTKEVAGKLILRASLLGDIRRIGLSELTFTSNHALELTRFGNLDGHDPFDRMILAQASAENLTLITADQTLLSLGFDWVMDATV